MEKGEKEAIIGQHRVHEKDTGSTEVQVALLTDRISRLTEHMRAHHHDYSTQRGLLMLVGQRRRLLAYLAKEDRTRYRALTEKLGIRRQEQAR